MKFETVKTFILILLIGTSLLLTFGLWTYQPNLSPLNDEELVNEVNIGGMEERRSTMVQPNTIVFHYYNGHFGFDDPSSQHELFREFQSWEMDNLEIGEADPERTPEDHEVEMLFPEDIPMEMITRIFSIEEDTEEMPSWSFNRMYVTFDQESLSLMVTFLSIDERSKASAVITNSDQYNELFSRTNSREDLTELLVLNEEENPVYFPREIDPLTRHSLSVTHTSADMLVGALFTNPSIVNRSVSPNINLGGSYYTDGVRELSVDQGGNTMEFFNPATVDYPRMDMTQLMRISIEHINDHGGWTGEYNLLEMDRAMNQITYQMYYDGYPVFNNFQMTNIVQEWRNQNLYRYDRPLFHLNNSLGTEETEIRSGEGLYDYLLGDESEYNLENITDISLGYDFTYHDSDLNDYVTLEPSWFMEYNNSSQEIQFGKNDDTPIQGGD
jgi:regulatory protein YycH of two-component signal transduction system YycFG